MADFFLQAIISNLLISSVLALMAWWIHHRFQAAGLANLLWVLVLIKLVTPPLFSVPMIGVQTMASNHSTVSEENHGSSEHDVHSPSEWRGDTDDEVVLSSVGQIEDRLDSAGAGASSWSWLNGFGFLWLAGSGLVFSISLSRIIRFHFAMRRDSVVATTAINEQAKNIASRIGLSVVPDIRLTPANISPFVLWTGGSPRIVMPQSFVKDLGIDDIRLILAHEMAHIKRRDHFVRWLEWLSGVLFWWNPVIWWAKREIRITEEIACDALVVERMANQQHNYAASLLNIAELLTTTAQRPPAVVSAMYRGGLLERRLTMIIADKTLKTPLWLRTVVCATALMLFPLGLVYAQDFEALEKRLGGAVEAGELSLEQANFMLESLKRASREQSDRARETDRAPRMDRTMRTDRAPAELRAREDMRRQFAEAARELESAVKRGDISKEDARKRMDQMQQRVDRAMQQQRDRDDRGAYERREDQRRDAEKRYEKYDSHSDREMEEKKKRYMAFAADIEAAVKAGKMSKEDAEQKLIDVRSEMFRRGAKPEESNKREINEKEKKFGAIQKEIEAAVREGIMTKDDAKAKLQEIYVEMFGGDTKRQKTDRVQRVSPEKVQKFEAAVAEVKEAIEAGKMTKEQGHEKLMYLKKEMLGDGGKEKVEYDRRERYKEEVGKAEQRLSRLQAAAREIEEAMKAGKISKEDGKAKFMAIREQMIELDRAKQDQDRAYAEKAEKVKADKARAEKAEKAKRAKVDKERAEKGRDDKAKAEKAEKADRAKRDMSDSERVRLRYQQAVEYIKKAVDAGDMSEEEAEKKLKEIQKRLKGDK